jgi:hypothetical protein
MPAANAMLNCLEWIVLQGENAKGYFEKFAVVNQNDALMKDQGTHWSANDLTYDPSAVLQQIMQVHFATYALLCKSFLHHTSASLILEATFATRVR